MTYTECMSYLYDRLPMFQRTGAKAYKADLNNTKRLMELLNHPELGFRSIHIAGTNGKGSSAHMLASVFQVAGYKTGLCTSPHLKDFTERIRINGKPIAQQAVIDFVEKSKEWVEVLKPSFFELTTAMCFDHFRNESVDIAIIETGLGGRLDSTNVVIPEVSLITNIGMDHADLLGNTRQKIAAEKAGIIKAGVPVVIGTYQEDVQHVFVQKSLEMNSLLHQVKDEYSVVMNDAGVVVYHSDFEEIELLKPDLGGFYLQKNLPGVLEVIRLINKQGKFQISKKAIEHGIANMNKITGLKGRYQLLGTNPKVIADVSHNADGMQVLMKQLEMEEFKQLHLVIGMVNDKDVRAVISVIPENAVVYATQSEGPRAMPADQLAGLFSGRGSVFVHNEVNEAIRAAKLSASAHDLILITGSTFVVAEIDAL